MFISPECDDIPSNWDDAETKVLCELRAQGWTYSGIAKHFNRIFGTKFRAPYTSTAVRSKWQRLQNRRHKKGNFCTLFCDPAQYIALLLGKGAVKKIKNREKPAELKQGRQG